MVKLYKYMPYRADILLNRLFRFTPSCDMNDIFEGQTTLNTYFQEYKDSKLSSKEIVARISKSIGGRPRFNVDSSLGIFSLSSSKHSLLMWSHYANEHKGIILEFDSTHPFFAQEILPEKQEKYPVKIGKLYPVKYDKVRSTDNDSIESLLLKSDDWMYEKEYRMFMPRSMRTCYAVDGERRALTDIDLFEIPESAITGVIAGMRSNTGLIVSEFIKAKLKNENLKHIKLELSEPCAEHFHINHHHPFELNEQILVVAREYDLEWVFPT